MNQKTVGASESATSFGAAVGFAALLFSFSRHHSRYTCGELQKYFVIPYRLRQYKLYFNPEGDVTGVVTWAWLSEYSLAKVLSDHSYDMHESEWNEGRNLYISDLVAPFGHFNEIINDLIAVQFPTVQQCHWVRRDANTKIRKVTRLPRARALGKSQEYIAGKP